MLPLSMIHQLRMPLVAQDAVSFLLHLNPNCLTPPPYPQFHLQLHHCAWYVWYGEDKARLSVEQEVL